MISAPGEARIPVRCLTFTNFAVLWGGDKKLP